MGNNLSPLRYPGGKTKIYKKVKNLIEANKLQNRIYIEPFAGGFGVGLKLLSEGIIHNAILNEYDTHVFNFWQSILNNTNEILELILNTEISLEERARQKLIYNNPQSTIVEDGFATLFLNRVNYSGVLFGGPIGGYSQNGPYLLNCRFKKDEIIKRIQKISTYKNNIRLFNCDAVELIRHNPDNAFYNMDPPYVEKGKLLYSKYYTTEDHLNLKNAIEKYLRDSPWILTYDNCDLIRNLYSNYYCKEYELSYSVNNRSKGKELVITNIPQEKFAW